MDKGTRVKVVKGRKALGVTGTVFWVGEDRYRPESKRLGIHGDDGETHWISADNVEQTDVAAPEASGPEPGKGDRVAFKIGDDEVEGEVFWVGPSKLGAGLRLGVKDPAGESHWLDAHQVRIVGGGTPDEEPVWDEEDPLF